MTQNRIDIVHTGPETPCGKYLRQFWQPVYLSDDLEKGWAKRIQILGEYFTLYRGESGDAHVVEDRCPHRRTQLSTGEIEGDDIRCFYHGWKFAADGTCLEQPTEFDSFKRKVCIRSYPVREYVGLIFAYFGEGEAPEFPEFPEAEYDNGYPLRTTVWELNYNYFQRLENDLDEAHVHFVHKISADETNEFSVLPIKYDAEETDYGILRLTTRDRDGKLDTRHKHFMMPNSGLTFPPPATALDDWSIHLSWRVPKNDEVTLSFVASRNKPRPDREKSGKEWQSSEEITQAILEGRMRLKDVDPYHPRLFNIQDNVAIGGQGTIYDEREEERLGRSDVAVIMMRKLYEREIRAMMEGQPIKRWKRPREKLYLGFRAADGAKATSGLKVM